MYQQTSKSTLFPTRRSSDLQKIADVLSAWDRTIELKKLLIKEKEEQKKGLKETIFSSRGDRKSTRLNSSHVAISYAVFCLKKKKNDTTQRRPDRQPRPTNQK